MPLSRILSVVLPALFVTALATPALAADVGADRVQGFRKTRGDLAEIRKQLVAGRPLGIVAPARRLEAFALRIPQLFPPGSKGGLRSRAEDEIWERFDDFSRMAKQLQREADALARLAASGTASKTALREAYHRVADTCETCHDPYRR